MTHHCGAQTLLRGQILEAADRLPSNGAIARELGCGRAYVGKVLRKAGKACADEPDEEHVPDHKANDAAYLAALAEHHPGGYPSLALPSRGAPKRRREVFLSENDVNTRGASAWPKSESKKVSLARRVDMAVLTRGRSSSNLATPSASLAFG